MSVGAAISLECTTVTGAASGPRLLITGGVHGDEFEPMAAIRRLLRLLEPARLRGCVTLAPVVNAPAFARRSRCGDDGLDLARTCPGRPDGTPTERIAHALTAMIGRADFYIDLHTGGTALSVFPLAGYLLVPDPQILDAQRRMARAFNLPVVWGTTANLEGRSMSAARDARVPAIYAEYRGGGACDPAGIEAYVEGCRNVLAELGMIEREPPPSRVRWVVEDDRENAGFMQIQNPAPCDGFFEPAVAPGDRIEAGQPLGTIADPLGMRTVTVPSPQTGIVLVLRTFPRVEAGDSLAVVLEGAR